VGGESVTVGSPVVAAAGCRLRPLAAAAPGRRVLGPARAGGKRGEGRAREKKRQRDPFPNGPWSGVASPKRQSTTTGGETERVVEDRSWSVVPTAGLDGCSCRVVSTIAWVRTGSIWRSKSAVLYCVRFVGIDLRGREISAGRARTLRGGSEAHRLCHRFTGYFTGPARPG